MKVLQAIGSAGFGEKIISEVLFQLMEWGLFPHHPEPLHFLQDLDTFLALDAVTELHEGQVLYSVFVQSPYLQFSYVLNRLFGSYDTAIYQGTSSSLFT
jgi:hypothetical protein